ncbi:hypothetical protein KUTeg_016757 [Tegillarca granosa]|uniref:Vitellogenin domain-containing protein n=1 Tax=Tegillarca granosa TaxID=220873 RepID=A0ABQ9EQM3_TEGGR|nr:hypothetical protein KUTeg_016757 [Tegillarca granosa]
MLAFKVMGNAGFEEWLPEVSRTLQDRSQPVAFRRMAAWSLGKTAKRSPIAVRDILLPIFFDQGEDEDVRIAAYYMSTLSYPPRPVFQQIVQFLNEERNPHVGTFVYTHVKYLAQSDDPCLMNMTKTASFALRFGKRFHPKYQFSRYFQYTSYNDHLKAGGTYRAGVISSPGEFIPRAVSVAMDAQVFGYSMTPIEFGYNMEGVQELLSKILGPGGSVSKSRSVVDILKQRNQSPSQSPREPQPSSQQQPPQPQEQLRVSPRQSPEPSGHVYYKLFDNEIRYVNLDRDFVSQVIQSGDNCFDTGELSIPSTEQGLQVGKPISFYKTYIMGNTENVLATEVGLPIHLKLRSSSMFKIEGRMSISGLPALFRSNRPGQDPNEISGRLSIQPSKFIITVLNIRGTMEIDANFLRSGAAINAVMHAEAPLTVTVAVNPMTNKYNTKVDVSQLKEKIMKMEITPQTFIQLEPHDLTKWPSQPETVDIDVMNGAKVTTFSTEFGQDRLGLKFSLKGQAVCRNFNPYVPYYPFSGKQQMYFTVTPGPNPPSMLEMEFKYLHSLQPARSQRESPEPSSGEENQDSPDKWSLWSSLSSLMGGSPEQQQQSQQQSQQPRQPEHTQEQVKQQQSQQQQQQSGKMGSTKITEK